MTGDPYAAVAETHISTVFFAGDRAYKLLKPLRTGFLDHSTPALRAEGCRREYELNRRMAADVYLGVSPVIERGITVDHMLVMRRMPSARRLTALLHGAEHDDAIRSVARAIAVFHAAQEPDPLAERVASREFVRELWHRSLEEMRPFGGSLLGRDDLEEAEKLATQYLDGRSSLFETRIAKGCARDGHGDLLAEDIFCLADGPRILDCLAFDDTLRVGDVLLDVAFLAMDLECLAGPDSAEALLRSYGEFSAEHHPRTLVDFYIGYRALVRCKVAALRAEQGSTEATSTAQGLLALALRHLRAARPRLVLIGGSPGTGKSTTAEALADRTGFMVLSSDALRKELAGVPPATHRFAPLDSGIYDRESTTQVYATLLHRAGQLLGLGESVILDASWASEESRRLAREAARDAGAEMIEIRCVLDPVEAATRVARRLRQESTTSDATPALAHELAGRFDPWHEAAEVDTRIARTTVASAAEKVIDRQWTSPA